MDKVNQILNHPDYQLYLGKIEVLERERIFCKHDMSHFLDVARIAYIWSFELGLKFDKPLIYGFALLHDIGRWCQYETGEPHDIASARLSKEILADTDYREHEVDMIVEAIKGHRKGWRIKNDTADVNMVEDVESGVHFPTDYIDIGTETKEFAQFMKKADKASRACHQCDARDQCKWPDDKKNLTIEV